MANTISHSERNKGWTSFWSYLPDYLLRLNNRFYSIKNGQLWQHNDTENSEMNNFYGIAGSSAIRTVINDVMAEDKIFKTLVLESNQKWQANIKTNLTDGEIKSTEFNTRESRQFSFIRGNENTQSLNGNAVQGLGAIISSSGNTLAFSFISDLVCNGDMLMQLNGQNQEQIGVITGINRELSTITVSSIITPPVNGYFSYAQKNSRVEGEEIRGYYLDVELINDNPEAGELFAVSTNAIKSYV